MEARPGEFVDLMKRVRAGSDEAARELFEQYGPAILRIVRRRLSQKLRSKFDSTDFTQAVWSSFFALRQEDLRFDSPEDLVKYLAVIARHKVTEAVRQRYVGRKYNINRERSLQGSAALAAINLSARQPSPSQLVQAQECWDQLLEKLPVHQRGILVLLRQGHSHVEIARIAGVDEKTIRRMIRRLAPEYLLKERTNGDTSVSVRGPDAAVPSV